EAELVKYFVQVNRLDFDSLPFPQLLQRRKNREEIPASHDQHVGLVVLASPIGRSSEGDGVRMFDAIFGQRNKCPGAVPRRVEGDGITVFLRSHFPRELGRLRRIGDVEYPRGWIRETANRLACAR